MNGRKAKSIRAHGDLLSVQWLKSLLSEEEGDKINIKNVVSKMPTQTHIFLKGKRKLSAYSSKWMYKKIKNILKRSPTRSISSIKLEELNEA